MTQEEISTIIDLYINHNETTVTLAKRFNCCDSTIGRILKKNNINPHKTKSERQKVVFAQLDINYICSSYPEKTTVDLASIYNCCESTIKRILVENNIPIAKAKRRSIIKHHNYFHEIDTIDKAYYLGLLIADGNVVQSKTRVNREKTISLQLNNKDKYIVEQFAKELGASKNKVKEYTTDNRNECYFRFSSNEMAKDLEQYGIIPQKTFDTYLPIISDNLMPHLLRGIFDGDGTNYIYYHKTGTPNMRFGFYGTKKICEDIMNYLANKIDIPHIQITEKVGCYMVVWQGDKLSKDFYNLIYSNCGNFYLKRKREKFDFYFNDIMQGNTEIT